MAAPYKRGKIYWARVQRKGVEYRDSLETTDFATAKRRFKQWLERLEATSWGERPRITFVEAVKQFIMQHCATLKPSSSERYGNSLKWLSDQFEGKHLDAITKASLAEFEAIRRGHGVSSSTIRRDLACLSSLLAFCEDREWIEDGGNFVKGWLRSRAKRGLKEGPSRTRWLSPAEEAKLLTLAKAKLPEAICLAIDTGLREQEMFSLIWSQVDLLNNVITTTTDTKNGRSRAVPLQARSAQFLAQWKALNSTRAVPSVFVFCKANGNRFKNLYRGFKILADKAQIADVCWHDLRRTAGCRWLQDKAKPKRIEEVSVLLGHSSIGVTQKSYAFLDQMQVARDAAAQNPAQAQADKRLRD